MKGKRTEECPVCEGTGLRQNNKKCRACKGKGKIRTSDWLIRGMTEEEIARRKEEALADLVYVVRCKDCKYLQVVNSRILYAKCAKTDYEFLPFETDTREEVLRTLAEHFGL